MRPDRPTFRLRPLAVALACLGCGTGCTVTHTLWSSDDLKSAREPAAADPLDRADELYRLKEYSKAESIFHDAAEDKKQSEPVREKARFMEGECLYMRDKWSAASDAYHGVVKDHPTGVYREQAVKRMFEIACDWLEDVRLEIDAVAKGEPPPKPGSDPLREKRKPTFGSEGKALQLLEHVHVYDPTGPYSDKALYFAGRVHFHRGNYVDADLYLTQLVEIHDRSKFREEAVQLAIMAKNNAGRGPAYDGRKASEAMKMIQQASHTAVPDPDGKRDNLLREQMYAVRMQQAAKDFEAADYYHRTGRLGSAWFCYELVVRRYPNVQPYYNDAVARMAELREEAERIQAGEGPVKKFWRETVLGHSTPIKASGPLPAVPGPAADDAKPPRDALPAALPPAVAPRQ